MEFAKKSNCVRHIRDMHYLESHCNNVSIDVEEDLVGNFEVPSNVMQVFVPVDEEFEVYIMNDHNEEMDEEVQINNASVTEEEEEASRNNEADDEVQMYNVSVNEEAEPSRNDKSDSSDEGVNIESLLREITSKVNVKNYEQEEKFISRVLSYIENRLKSRDKLAMQFLNECFRDLKDDPVFMSWLAKNLKMKTTRLREIALKYAIEGSNDNTEQETPGRPFTGIGKSIYEFWKNNSTVSNDSSNSRDIVRKAKIEYLKEYKHVLNFDDEDLSEVRVIFNKTGNKKMWVKSSRRIYIKPSRDFYQDFLGKSEVPVSFSTFYKYKPFYVTSPTEREKDCCLCIKCLNVHLLLKSINSYRKQEKGSTKHPSATRLMKDLSTAISENDDEIPEKFPEYTDNKVTSFYRFKKTLEKFFNKKCEEKMYTRTSRVDSKLPISEITKLFLESMDAYLLHRKSVNNDRFVWPLYMNNFDGKFFHLDFSENINLVEKHQAQEANYSGKQYTLHCAWMHPPSPQKYIYHQ